jgi:hypothetical protein
MTESVQVATVVEVFPTRAWVKRDIMGTMHVWLQHEGCEPFDFVQIQYDYRYTSNSHSDSLARQIVGLMGLTVGDAVAVDGS